jgi:predicted transglutaminase-like cysteine proteinase
MPEHWEPASVRGDCEDYALAKRAQLLAAGWPLIEWRW